jgi:hypothetical protein
MSRPTFDSHGPHCGRSKERYIAYGKTAFSIPPPAPLVPLSALPGPASDMEGWLPLGYDPAWACLRFLKPGENAKEWRAYPNNLTELVALKWHTLETAGTISREPCSGAPCFALFKDIVDVKFVRLGADGTEHETHNTAFYVKPLTHRYCA